MSASPALKRKHKRTDTDDGRTDPRIATTEAMDLRDRIVKLSVGESGSAKHVIVNVHRNVLCKHSDFFKNATKKEWSELNEDSDTVVLATDDPDVVEAYVHWLYCQQVPAPATTNTHTSYCFLARAYVFGQKILDSAFKNAIIDALVAVRVECNTIPTSQMMNTIFEGTSDDSPARRLVVDLFVDGAHGHDGFKAITKELSKEVLTDVMLQMLEKRPAPNNRQWLASHAYHETKST